MENELKYYVDYATLQSSETESIIRLKGWIHEKDFLIRVKSGSKVLIEFKPNVLREDVKALFDEKNDYIYGFEKTEIIRSNPKRIKVYYVVENKEFFIQSASNGFFATIKKKIRKLFYLLKESLTYVKNEYGVFAPVSEYFEQFRYIIKNLKIEENQILDYYDPQNKEQYNEYICKYERIKAGNPKNLDISFLVLNHQNTIKDSIEDYQNVFYLDDNSNIQEAVNRINTTYLCLVDSKCMLRKDFLAVLEHRLNKNYDLIYFDHDELDENDTRYHPYFKPDYSIDTLLGSNYIGPCYVIKKDLVVNSKSNNMFGILVENIDNIKKVKHLAKVMYHTKHYKFDQNEIYSVLTQHFDNTHQSVELIKNSDKRTVSIKYLTKESPLISIIIPTKDHSDDLRICLESIYNKTEYKNYEIVLVDNNSEEKETFDLIKEYEEKHGNFYSLRLECPFNYSYINNEAVKEMSHGEYVLFLNNDTEVISSDWLDWMVGYASLSHVGTVGVKLRFSDNSIQHAGIILGKGGVAGHAHYKEEGNIQLEGCWDQKIPYNISACTAACLMISKEKFMKVSCFDEQLAVAFNDVDLNMKTMYSGLYNIYLPNVELYHHESKSRGLDVSPEKQRRFAGEVKIMYMKWKFELHHDYFYNKKLSLVYDYMLPTKKGA